MTMTEDYVSFETAKLLKEKGFDELCPTFYETDEPDNGPKYSKVLGWFLHNSYDYSDRHGKMIISAPTLQIAMKWLREKYGLHCSVIFHLHNDWEPCILELHKDKVPKNYLTSCSTYEEACEAAIKYCLENLI